MNYDDFIAETFKSDEFQKELYNTTLEVAVNRLESQTSDVSQKSIFAYVQDLFSVNAKLQNQVIKQKQHSRSQQTLLKVHVERGENLASKDVDGSSDPYCVMAVVSGSQFTNLKSSKHSPKTTSVINSNLNPEWKETFEIPLTRDQIQRSFLQIQIWDYDGEESVSKKVKGVKGIKRYVKEKAQNVSKKGQSDQDDFMGFNSIPLANIQADGLESWFKLRTAHTLQGVTGRLKLRLTLNSVNEPAEEKKYKNDILYAGLLRKVVLKAYADYYAEMKGDVEMWAGDLPVASQVLLQEFEKQCSIPRFTAAIVRWEVYAALHVKSQPGVKVSFMEKMLVDLEQNSHHAKKHPKSTPFNLDMLSFSIKTFIAEENKKIADHRKIFSIKTKDYIIALGSVLLVFKKLNTMGLYQMLRVLDPSLPSDVRMVVIKAVEKGTSTYYVSLYETLLEESLDLETPEDQNELDQAFGGTDIRVLIKLAELLQKDLLIGKSIYHGVFLKVLDIDYLSYVSNAIENHLAADTNITMDKVNAIVKEKEFTTESIQNSKNSLLFRLYLAMRELAAVIKTKGTLSNHTLGPNSPKRNIEKIRLSLIENDELPPITLHNYHGWFRPTLLKWLQMSKGNSLTVITKAIEVDSAQRVDDIVKHSSSAVDTVACLNGHVVTFWRSLQWPDPIDAYTIALRLTDDLASSIETYADLVYRKLRSVGFFDDEGQFDVTEELCLTLNNLQHVKEYLSQLPKKMGFQEIADAVDADPVDLSGQRVSNTFTALCSTAEIGMRNKIKAVQTGVGVKMKDEIRKYLRQFAQTLSRASEGDYQRHHDISFRQELEDQSEKAILPLMDYLKNNVITLNDWLCQPIFQRLLEVLWDITIHSFNKVILQEFVEQKSGFFYQSRFAFTAFLTEFFHADGNGLSEEKLNCPNAEILESELKMRSAKTRDLIKLFYMQMYEEQLQNASKPQFGVLNVFAWYDNDDETLHLDVISADGLVPLDLNGFSDPFVQLRLAPAMMFRNQRSHQTLIEKSTLSPIWTEENFTYQIEKSLMEEDGTVAIFTVLDHDIISSDDLEGEAVLPLNLLDGIQKEKHGETLPRHFRLPLIQPSITGKTPFLKQKLYDENRNGVMKDGKQIKSAFSDLTLDDNGLTFESSLVISPLYLLRARCTYDKNADEFCRWRRKLEKAKEDK